MNASTRILVRSRAARRCEYCQLHERDLPLFPFDVEHIVARKHGGTDHSDNLAWSCHHCNLAKSSNLSGFDPETGRIAVLFHPRQQRGRAISNGPDRAWQVEPPVAARQLPS